jgi:Flp pilus assembly pilin Flp
MRLPSLIAFCRTYRGASLLEYSLLSGLIVIASIGTVISLGEEVSTAFDSASSALNERMTAEGPDRTEVPDQPEVVLTPGLADWSIVSGQNAARVFSEDHTVRGYTPYWQGAGTDLGSSGAFEMYAFYSLEPVNPESTHSKSSRIHFLGDQRDQLQSNMAVKCNEGTNIPLSTALEMKYIPYDSRSPDNPGRTQISWDGLVFPFVEGKQINCQIS